MLMDTSAHANQLLSKKSRRENAESLSRRLSRR